MSKQGSGKMRVELCFPMTDGQTGPALQYAFEQLGHTVRTVDAKLYPGRSYPAAMIFNPDLVFCSRTEALTEQVMRIKNHPTLSPKIALWNVDTRTSISAWSHLFPLIRLCDYHFVVDSKLIPEWKAINPNTFWVPQGLQNELYKKPLSITDEDREKYACDVSWAGEIDSPVHAFRKPFIEAVERMGVNFKAWGCKGRPQVYGEEHNKMVSLSKINLGMSAFPENEDCVSVRDFKIMGAGGLLLELWRKGLYDIFPDGKTFSVVDYYYSDPVSLTRRIEVNLTNSEARRGIARQGFEWIHSHATYTHRIRTILNIMGMGER